MTVTTTYEEDELFMLTLTHYHGLCSYGVDIFVYCSIMTHYHSIVKSLREIRDRNMAGVLLKAYERDFFCTVAKHDMDIETYKKMLCSYNEIAFAHDEEEDGDTDKDEEDDDNEFEFSIHEYLGNE
jgi:hypothetical protein